MHAELYPPYYDEQAALVIHRDRVWYRSGHASGFDTGADDLNGWKHRMSSLTMKVVTIKCSHLHTSRVSLRPWRRSSLNPPF
jgi:hypothetical protein